MQGYGIIEAVRYTMEPGGKERVIVVAKFENAADADNLPRHMRADSYASRVNGLFMLTVESKKVAKRLFPILDKF